MSKNEGPVDRLVRGAVAIVALIVAFVVGIGSVAGVILALVAAVMAVTAGAGFCPLYWLFGLSTARHTAAPR
jgi:predicted RND superfamily exporter protein